MMQDLARYHRQILYEQMGESAQRRLSAARVLLIGCGALGTAIGDTLVRAGVGFLRIVDRDFVELNNLQRQVLFNERHVAEGAPKAVAAAEQLLLINSGVVIEPIVADVNSGNIESLADPADLILDGTDNFETRFLVNDVAVKRGIPWVYGACVAAEGMVLPILPGRTPCLRCVFEEPPPAGASATCDTAGVLGPVVHVVAALQCTEAMKILTGQFDAVCRRLVQINVWTGEFTGFDMQGAFERGDCPCCKGRRFEFLEGGRTGRAAILCGRDAVQISPAGTAAVDLPNLARRISAAAKSAPVVNRYLARFAVDEYEITVFADGRAVIKGTQSVEEARSIYSKYVGA